MTISLFLCSRLHAADGFVEVERIHGFKRLAWTRFGPKVVVAPMLYIMMSSSL